MFWGTIISSIFDRKNDFWFYSPDLFFRSRLCIELELELYNWLEKGSFADSEYYGTLPKC